MREFWVLKYKLNEMADMHVSRTKPKEVDPSWEVIHVKEVLSICEAVDIHDEIEIGMN